MLVVSAVMMPALAPLGLSLMMGGIAQIISPQATNESVRQADKGQHTETLILIQQDLQASVALFTLLLTMLPQELLLLR